MKCANHPEKEAIGLCNRCGKSICFDCHGEVKAEIYCRDCLATKNPDQKSHQHSPVLAATLSLLIPGLGQFYNGQPGKGLLVFLTFLLIFPWVLGIVDAYCTGKKIKEGKFEHQERTGCLISFVIMVVISWVTFFITILFLAIAIPNMILARCNANESFVKENLKIVSTELESYKAKKGDYLSFFAEGYNGKEEIKGYFYTTKLTPYSYTVTATPASCGLTGNKVFIVKTGGVISFSNCYEETLREER